MLLGGAEFLPGSSAVWSPSSVSSPSLTLSWSSAFCSPYSQTAFFGSGLRLSCYSLGHLTLHFCPRPISHCLHLGWWPFCSGALCHCLRGWGQSAKLHLPLTFCKSEGAPLHRSNVKKIPSICWRRNHHIHTTKVNIKIKYIFMLLRNRSQVKKTTVCTYKGWTPGLTEASWGFSIFATEIILSPLLTGSLSCRYYYSSLAFDTGPFRNQIARLS